LLIILKGGFEGLFLSSWTVACHMSLLVASEASSSGLVVLFFSFGVCTSDLCKVGRIYIHWDYLVIRMNALLLALWFGLLCTSYPLEFSRSRVLDCLSVSILPDLYMGIPDVFINGRRLIVSMEDSILKVAFYAHYEELNCSRMRKIKLCLFGIVFEC